MSNKFLKPNILFLDDDLEKSSQYLNNKNLSRNIRNVAQVILAILFYYKGIRSDRIFRYYFSKDNKTESIDRFLPTYPFDKISFNKYTSQEAKWGRKCLEHFSYLVTYFECLLNEWMYRFGKDHELYELLDFYKTMMFNMKIPKANIKKIVLPYKNLPIRFRKRNLVEGYRKYYRSILVDPMAEYSKTKRDVPSFLLDDYLNGESLC